MFGSELNQVSSPRFCRIAARKGKVSSLNAFNPDDCCSVGENSAAASRACQMPRGMLSSTCCRRRAGSCAFIGLAGPELEYGVTISKTHLMRILNKILRCMATPRRLR